MVGFDTLLCFVVRCKLFVYFCNCIVLIKEKHKPYYTNE